MVARHYYRSVPDDPVTEVPTVLRWGYTLQEKAEEGEAPMIEVVVDDPDMSLDFVGHRRWVIYEDDSEDDNEVIYSGLTQSVKIAHKGGDITNPVGRVWTISIADLNTLWSYRVMIGSDSQFPEQTDVERMQQLVDSEEMGYFDDLTLLSTASPVNMDKANGRGQSPAQIADSCAQQSGKNWWIGSTGSIASGSDIFVWYGKDSLAAYVSPLSLSNDLDDLDMAAVDAGSATTYPIGSDTSLLRDYARQYSGAYGEFQGGAVYVSDPVTEALITASKRDMTYPAPEIKSRTRMKARLQRVLLDHRGPDEVISTTIYLPGNKLSQLRAGMRVPFKATHEPGYETSVSMRVMSASPSPIGRKGGYDWYKVALELQGPGIPAPVVGSCSTILGASASEDETQSNTTAASVTTTPPSGTVLIAWLAANDQDTPGATNMSAIAGGYTEMLDEPSNSRSTFRIAAKAATGGVASTASGTYTAGFASNGLSVAAHIALDMSSHVPVQSVYVGPGYQATLPSPPTTGNIILVFAYIDSYNGSALDPNTDPTKGPTNWTQLYGAEYNGTGGTFAVMGLAVFAHCVEAGESGVYAWGAPSGYTTGRAIFVAEFAP